MCTYVDKEFRNYLLGQKTVNTIKLSVRGWPSLFLLARAFKGTIDSNLLIYMHACTLQPIGNSNAGPSLVHAWNRMSIPLILIICSADAGQIIMQDWKIRCLFMMRLSPGAVRLAEISGENTYRIFGMHVHWNDLVHYSYLFIIKKATWAALKTWLRWTPSN
jgi:hypothetical protein